MGNGSRGANIPINHLPFRQDSALLYLSGLDQPNGALLMGPEGDTLFLVPPDADDPLWHGHAEVLSESGQRLGFDQVRPLAELEQACAPLRGQLSTLAVGDEAVNARAAAITGQPLSFGRERGSPALMDALIQLRRRLEPEEAEAMRQTAAITAAAHRAAMAATRPGRTEAQICALFNGVIAAAGHRCAYETIATVRGEVLHNFHHRHRLEEGQIFLLDGGAEAWSGHATDVTRTWPVSGRYSPRQRAAHLAVLEAQRAAISLLRPGARYRDIHLHAALVLSRWLADEGLLRCSPEAAVESGAHALFFPHGLGHLIGLDVHDLEAYGDRAAYAPGRHRSTQFGTAFLRLDLDLEPGMAVTIEPGFYIVPAILHDPDLCARFAPLVDLDRARAWAPFGGIRIEDDLLITAEGSELLTPDIPSHPDHIEAIVGTADALTIG
jgi:Xaa-Pro aminopeptidase